MEHGGRSSLLSWTASTAAWPPKVCGLPRCTHTSPYGKDLASSEIEENVPIGLGSGERKTRCNVSDEGNRLAKRPHELKWD